MESLGFSAGLLALLFAFLASTRSETLLCEYYRPCLHPDESYPRISDEDLRKFSETLLASEVNNAAQRVRIDYQEQINPGNFSYIAPKPLLSITANLFEIPSINLAMQMLDNYNANSSEDESEFVLQSESTELTDEVSDLLQLVSNSAIFELTHDFLATNGLITRDMRSFLGLILETWFTYFPREIAFGSSAYEHIFLAELEDEKIISIPNWIFFSYEESAKRAQYMGYIKRIRLGQQGDILKFHYKWSDLTTVGCMFVGSSPELEMALFLTCFLARPNEPCQLSLKQNVITIHTTSENYEDVNRVVKLFKKAAIEI